MEFFDIYDAYGNKTGRQVPHGYKLQDGEYRFISHLLIFNSKNELLIQKRAEDKYDWPGYYDLSAGGGVNAGETSYQAAKRECKEEYHGKLCGSGCDNDRYVYGCTGTCTQ